MIFLSNSSKDTEHIGECIGKIAEKGYIICLIGDLGVGKTEFAKGVAKGLGVEDYITSPTFTIVNEYMGRLPLYHFDVYRINDIEEMYEIGYEEYFYGDGVCIIEWADLIKDIIPDENITVRISKDIEEGTDFRSICIETNGDKYKDILHRIIEECEF